MRVCVHLLYDSIQHTLSGGTYILRLTCPTRTDLLVNSLLICATVVVGAAEERKKERRGEIVDTYYVRSLHAAAACCSYVGVLFSLGLLSVRRCLLWMCLYVCMSTGKYADRSNSNFQFGLCKKSRKECSS